MSKPAPVQLLASSNGPLQIWLNGKMAYQRKQARAYRPDSDRCTATLAKGNNRLLVVVGATKGAATFHLHFRRRSSTAERERLIEAALTRRGDPERGRKLFFNAEKSLCIKCHRLNNQGERVGPELTAVGKRFSRIYLIESILEPSRTIAPSFGSVAVALKNGQVLTGIKTAESSTKVTLVDNQGKKHELAKNDIDELLAHPQSTMPEDLIKRFKRDEFIDLIAFLASQR